MIASITASNTCPCCGAVRRTEPVLPKLPKRSNTAVIGEYVQQPRRKEELDRWGRVYRSGRWITID